MVYPSALIGNERGCCVLRSDGALTSGARQTRLRAPSVVARFSTFGQSALHPIDHRAAQLFRDGGGAPHPDTLGYTRSVAHADGTAPQRGGCSSMNTLPALVGDQLGVPRTNDEGSR